MQPDALEPDQQRFVVNAGDHFQRQQRMREKDAQQGVIVERLAREALRGDQHVAGVVRNRYRDRVGVVRRLDPETVRHVHRHEGRNIELLRTVVTKRFAVRVDRKEISVTLPECVVDLVEDRLYRAIDAIAEEDAQRIEGETENARHGQEADRAAPRLETGVTQDELDFAAQIASAGEKVILRAKSEEIEAREREQPELFVERR